MDQNILDSYKDKKCDHVDPYDDVQSMIEEEENKEFHFTEVKSEEPAFYPESNSQSASQSIEEEPALLVNEGTNSLCTYVRPEALGEGEVADDSIIRAIRPHAQPQCSFVNLETCQQALKNGLTSAKKQSGEDGVKCRYSWLVCELCGVKTFHIRSFKYHLVSRHLTAKAANNHCIHCPYCQQKFCEDTTYLEHLKHHSKGTAFLRCCPYCRLVCHYRTFIYHCNSHLTTTSELRSYCQGKLATMGRCLSLDDVVCYMKYSQTSDDNLFLCTLCKFVSDQGIAYQQHLMMDHLVFHKSKEGLMKCPHCLFSCWIEQQFNLHLKGHKQRMCHPCMLCSSKFLTKLRLERHILSHLNGSSASPDEHEPGKQFDQVLQNKEYETRLGGRSETVEIDPCLHSQSNAMFFKQANVLDRIKSMYLNFEGNCTDDKMKCEYCSYSTVRWITLIYHYIRKHVSYKCEGEDRIQCPHCIFSFLLDCEFHNHMLVHYNENRYPCPQCLFVEATLPGLCGHFVTSHFEEPKLMLPPGSAMASKSDSLMSGKAYKNTAVNHSGKIYLDAANILRKLANKLPKGHMHLKKCPICLFSSRALRKTGYRVMKFHIISHLASERSSSGDIECPHCLQKYQVEYLFRRHLTEAHNGLGEQGLQHCPFCTFTQKGSRMMKHVLTVHGTALHHLRGMRMNQSMSLKSITNTPNRKKVYVDANFMRQVMRDLMSKSNEYPHKCPFCLAVRKTSPYVMRRHIITHLASQRSDQDCIHCPHCDVQFDEEDLFRRHLTKAHRDFEKLYCPFCPSKVVDSQLTTHLLNVHGPFLSPVTLRPDCCPHCNLSGLNQRNLDIHLKKCHLDKLKISDIDVVSTSASKNFEQLRDVKKFTKDLCGDGDKKTSPSKRKRTRPVPTSSDTRRTVLLPSEINSSTENSSAGEREPSSPTTEESDDGNEPRSSKTRRTKRSTSSASESQSMDHFVPTDVCAKPSNGSASDNNLEETLSALEDSDDISYTMSCPRCLFITSDVTLYEIHLRDDHKFRK